MVPAILALVGQFLVKTRSSQILSAIYLVNSLCVVANGYWNKHLTCMHKGSAGPIVENYPPAADQ